MKTAHASFGSLAIMTLIVLAQATSFLGFAIHRELVIGLPAALVALALIPVVIACTRSAPRPPGAQLRLLTATAPQIEAQSRRAA